MTDINKETAKIPEHTIVNPEFQEVELQLASWCNRSCSFCPCGDENPQKKLMSQEVIERIVGELEKINFSKSISFHLMSEPLLFIKRFPQTLKFIRERLPNVYMRFDTNGDIIKDYEILEKLFDCGLNEVQINCYDTIEQVQRRNHEILKLQKKHKDIWYWNMWELLPKKPLETQSVIKLRDCHEGNYTFKNWAGAIESMRGEDVTLPLKLFCRRPFHKLHVNYKGEVLLCNLDYKFQVIVGDLMLQSLPEAWNSSKMQEYRRRLTEKDRDALLCRNCDNGIPIAFGPIYPHADGMVKYRNFLLSSYRKILRRVNGSQA